MHRPPVIPTQHLTQGKRLFALLTGDDTGLWAESSTGGKAGTHATEAELPQLLWPRRGWRGPEPFCVAYW